MQHIFSDGYKQRKYFNIFRIELDKIVGNIAKVGWQGFLLFIWFHKWNLIRYVTWMSQMNMCIHIYMVLIWQHCFTEMWSCWDMRSTVDRRLLVGLNICRTDPHLGWVWMQFSIHWAACVDWGFRPTRSHSCFVPPKKKPHRGLH